MKAESTIEKKERDVRQTIQGIDAKDWFKLDYCEKSQHESLVNYWRALRWVLGKDDDEMCLAQGEKRSTNSPDSP